MNFDNGRLNKLYNQEYSEFSPDERNGFVHIDLSY